MEIGHQTTTSRAAKRAHGLAPLRGIGLGVLLGSALWLGLWLVLSFFAGHC